jgi:hypothetical protein
MFGGWNGFDAPMHSPLILYERCHQYQRRVAPDVNGSVAISAASKGLKGTPSFREQCKGIPLREAA